VAESLRSSIARGVAWVSVAASVVAALDIVSLALILKYWTTAEQYGAVSVGLTMFGPLQLVGEAGLPVALVLRDDNDEGRTSTIYWMGLATGAVMYGAICFAAPAIARAYDLPMLVNVLRVAGLMLVVRPLYTTHQALLRKHLRFRELSIVRIIANAVGALAMFAAAILGGGAWAFIAGPLAREIVFALGVPRIVAWRPRAVFRPAILGADYRFGLRSTGGELVFQVYSNLDYQVVAYCFGPAALGIYRAAYELVLEPVKFASGVIMSVAAPAFAKLRTDRAALAAQFVAFARQNLGFVLLLIGVIVVGARELLELALGPPYAVAADATRVLAIVAVLRALSHLGPPLLDGVGRPDLTLRYQLVAAILVSTGFVAATWLGSTYFAVALAWAVCYPIAFAVLARLVLAQLGLSVASFVAQIGRVVVSGAIATGCGALVHAGCASLAPTIQVIATSATVVGLGAMMLRWYAR
jgi:O-antigen/teichoic acid export membrane protein